MNKKDMAKIQNFHDFEVVSDALRAIPFPLPDYNDWARIGLALWASFEMEGMRLLYDVSCAPFPEYRNETPEKLAAKFRNANGSVSLGTIFHIARQHGWKRKQPTKIQNDVWHLVAWHDYTDAQGNFAYRMNRYVSPDGAKKRMTIERYQNGKEQSTLPPELRLPYNLPQVREAIEQGKTIYFVEGESDADALAANGHTATCVPCGAGGWNQRYVEHFKGANICFVPDNDKTGKTLPVKAIPDLLSVAKDVKVIELCDAKDVRELINTKGIQAFLSLTPIDANQYLEKHKLPENYPLQSLNGTPQQTQTHNGTAQPQPHALLLTKPLCSWLHEAKAQPPITPLFDVFWLSNELAFCFATTNLGKTILAVQLLDAISKGAKVQNFDGPQKPMKVCLFDFELSARQFLKRYSDGSGNIHDFSPNFLRTEIDANAEIPKGISFQDYILAQIEQTIIENGIEAVVIDNLTALISNVTDSKDALELMHRLRLLKLRQNISMLVLTHSPKRDLTRPIGKNDMVGSMHLLNLCDSAFCIGESVKESNVRYLKQIKTRSAEFKYDSENVAVFRIVKHDRFIGFEHIGFDDEREHLRERTDAEMNELEMNIIALHQSDPNLSYSEIAKQLNTSKAKVCRVLKKAKSSILNTPTPF